jgi:uncharacterized repeat protein (TIGR01451 family)
MAIRALLASVVSLSFVSICVAQRPFETAEPPLADGSNASGIQQASATRVVDGPMPVVQLSVRAPTTAATGSPVPVKLIVENTARSPARNVTLFYPLPAGATVEKATPEAAQVAGGVSWRIESLAAASKKEITFHVVAAAGSAELTHKARIAFEFEPIAPTTRFAKPELKVRKYGPDQALRHDILVMAIDVTNTGSAELIDLQLVDALPDGLEHRPDDPSGGQPTTAKPRSEISADKKTRTFKIGRLAPNQTVRVDYYATAVNAAGPVVHSATAMAAGMAEPARAENKVTVSEPKLEVIVETPPRRPANQPCRVQIKLTNKSLRALANVVVIDRVGGGAALESASIGGQSFNGSAQWIVPMLAANETRVFEAVVRCPQGGRVVHQVSAVYRGLNQVAESATEFEALAALQWEFRASSHAIELNGEVQYALSIRNAGSAPAINVRPTITLPAELALVKATPAAATEGGKAAFEAATIPPGGRLICTVTAKAVGTAAEARAIGELTADVLTAGPVRKQEIVMIGRNERSTPMTPPGPQPPLPTPVKPPTP